MTDPQATLRTPSTARSGVVPRPRDAATIEALRAASEVESVHAITTSWWNNASFALPLLAALVSLALGLGFRSFEALGFGAFLLAVTVCMLPVVLLTWRRTPTSMVLTQRAVVALHEGRVLRELPWASLARIERSDYGNVRWRLRPTEGDHVSIEAELSDVDGLVANASRLSGLEPEG